MFSLTLLRNTCSSAVTAAAPAVVSISSVLTLSSSSLTTAAFSSLKSLSCSCLKSVIFIFVILTSLREIYSAELGVYFERSPESAVAPKGDEVVFDCEVNLTPERLEWKFRHSSNRTDDGSKYKYLTKENGSNITLDDRISMLRIVVQPETLGDYQCVAWYGSAAIASLSARLTLVSISIDNSNGYSRNAKIFNVAPKNCVLLRCGSVTSNPAAIWSFYRNGEKVPQSEIIPTNGALILNTVTAKDSGNYTCSAMNPITGQEVKLPQRIDLRVDYSDRNPPHFLIPPVTQVTARPGDTVVLECPGVGSPPPTAVWSSPNTNINNNNRTRLLAYGLQISDVISEDEGSYTCRLDNGIAPALVHLIKFTVLKKPSILRGPASTVTNESYPLELECSATGNPYPDIYWLINGIDTSMDEEMIHDGRRLVIKHVQKRHAGIVQCFAKNEVGETSAANPLKINPKQIHGSSTPLGNVPTKVYEHVGNHKTKGKTKKQPKATMVPPSRPNVTRLSDNSVMLRWYVPKNDGLPIQFFKVQYRMLGDVTRTIPRDNWQTTNEELRFNKIDHSNEGFNNFTSSVTGLKPDRFYRFRIIAVYSNNDNKEGVTSTKFFLRKGEDLDLSNLPKPELQSIESLTESAVLLQWSLPNVSASEEVEGFYAYYRPSSSAGEYLKTTIDGRHTRKFKIDMLEAGTTYEFKLQSFNEMAASEFSAIVQGITKKSPTTPATLLPSVVPASKTNQEDDSIYPVVAGAAGGGILLLIASITVCLCMKKRKNSQAEDENKPQLDHIQADFVTPQVLGVNNHHKPNHRLNGVLPRMNITPNPLAQEADKAHLASQGIHHAQPYYQTPPTPTLMAKRDYQQPPPVPPHQNNNHTLNHHHHLPPSGHANAPLTPCLDQQRRTLDRSVRNMPYNQNPGNNHEPNMNMEGLGTRIPSLRRTRRTSGGSANNGVNSMSNNPNGGIGIPIAVAAGSPRVQRSPMPARAAMMKQRSRLGSHNDNISSGSLNSIEV